MKNILLLLFLLNAISCKSQDYSIPSQKTDLILSKYIEQANIPGLSIAISIDNKIVYAKSFGIANIEEDIAASNETKYRIGSVTKLLTSVAVVKLIEDKIIDKNDLIQKYIKNLPEAYQAITIAQLAGHLAGIRHYTKDERESNSAQEYKSLQDAFHIYVNDSLVSKPGTEYHYTTYGYSMLGAVLEQVTNKKFTDIIEEYILNPAEMYNTIPVAYKATIDNISQFYYVPRNSNEFVIAEDENNSYKWPAAGYVSTASDLTLFGSSLITKNIVNDSSLKLLFTPQKTSLGEVSRVGFGFRIGKDLQNRIVLHHGGSSPGGRAFFLIYPEQKLTIAVLANVRNAPVFEGEVETIAGYFLNQFSYVEELTLSGVFQYKAQNRDKEMEGSFSINEKTITNFLGNDIPIIDVVHDYGKIRIIALSKNGIINIWVTKNKNKYVGFWGYDKPINKFEMQN